MDWCEECNMIHLNSWYQKDIEKKITYRELGTEITQHDINWESFAELDHAFTRKNGETL